jgi:hypothetical protein
MRAAAIYGWQTVLFSLSNAFMFYFTQTKATEARFGRKNFQFARLSGIYNSTWAILRVKTWKS